MSRGNPQKTQQMLTSLNRTSGVEQIREEVKRVQTAFLAAQKRDGMARSKTMRKQQGRGGEREELKRAKQTLRDEKAASQKREKELIAKIAHLSHSSGSVALKA
jgi:hypothetical protein